MKSSINCGLKGQYQVNIKNREGQIVESTDWFDNDITNVGMNYPFFYSFARCFMFLSLGLQPVQSTISPRSLATGLPSPSTGYMVYDPNVTTPLAGWPLGFYIQSGTYIGWPGYELGSPKNNFTNTNSTTCGTTFTNQGINFYRGWTIPTGLEENPGSYLAQPNGLNIQSFMVSPSSGGDKLGQYAFSVVDRQVLIPSGFSATITYQLSLSFPTYTNPYTIFQSYTGASAFSYTGFTGNYTGNPAGWFSLTNAATGLQGSETGLLALWGNLSGIYRQIYPGIELVNPLGGCILPARGNQMEPYITSCPNLNFYLSPDISQFAVSKFNQGGPATGEYGAYNSIGLSCNYIESLQFQSTGSNPPSPNVQSNDSLIPVFPSSPNDYYYSGINDNQSSLSISSEGAVATTVNNIRLTSLLPISQYNSGALPFNNATSANYATTQFVSANSYPVSYATAGSGINTTFTNYGNRAIVSSYLRELPNGISTPTGNTGTWTLGANRVNSVNKKGFFPPILSLGTNSRYGSLTLGYNTQIGPIANASFAPYIDFLFFDTSGRAANMPHYRIITDLYLTNRGSGVAQVLFYVTGAKGIQPTSIQRFWGAQGFMGPGFVSNPSGLDPSHPMYGGIVYDTSPPSFIPAGNNISGYNFRGQILTSSVLGNDGFTQNIQGSYTNGGTGWGAVYGIVATTGFYQSQLDCGLVDSPVWSGYSGGIPDSTGTPLFWPVTGSGLGLLITGVQYYLKGYSDEGYGNVIDFNNFYSSGIFQMLGDISLTGAYASSTGSFFDIVNNSKYAFSQFSLNGAGNPYQSVYLTNNHSNPAFTDILQTNSGFTPNGILLTGIEGNITLSYFTGNDLATYVGITGFNYSAGLKTTRGSGQSWTGNYASQLLLNGASPFSVGTSNGSPIYMTLWDSLTTSFYPINSTSQFTPSPTQLCAPSGLIRHIEGETLTGANGFATAGWRLLPNYALPNNNFINTYTPVKGGAFPGLSTENGMEIFLNFIWSG